MEYIIYGLLGIFVILILYGVCFVNFSFQRFKSATEKYSHNQIDTPKTYQFVEKINNKYFWGRLFCKVKKEKFEDCFKPGSFSMEISENIASSSSIYAFSVVAHEMGHAMQLVKNKAGMLKYLKRIRTSKFLSNIIWPIIIGAVVLFFLKPELMYVSIALLVFSILCFFVSLSNKLNTVKFEWEASEIGLELLRNEVDFDNFQLNICKEILTHAKNTYLADFWRSCLKWTLLVR